MISKEKESRTSSGGPFASIRFSMYAYTLAIIFFMALLSIYSLGIMDRYRESIEDMFEEHIYLSDMENRMDAIDENLLGFLSTKSSTSLNNYVQLVQELQLGIQEVELSVFDPEQLMKKNIASLVGNYVETANKAIEGKRQRNAGLYFMHYEESRKIKGFIEDYISELNSRQLNRNAQSYGELVNQISLMQVATYVIIVDLVLLSLVAVYLIASVMVRPIVLLTRSAEEIGKGNFRTRDVILESTNEFAILADVFNRMKHNILEHIEDVKLKAEAEAALKDEQLKNMRMAYLLDNARLYALQSQINPHFLFNTINAGVQMAIMERAPKTSRFFESMSRLFRYNIRKMKDSCSLADEVGNIKDYYELLRVRFGDRIRFEFDVDEEALALRMPPLVLQPLVENAFIHGLSGLEEGGTIRLLAERQGGRVLVIVADTGKGIPKETVRRILDGGSRESGSKGSEGTGIGVRNVRDRLELFYHEKGIFDIASSEGAGTQIIMDLPMVKDEGGGGDVQDAYRG